MVGAYKSGCHGSRIIMSKQKSYFRGGGRYLRLGGGGTNDGACVSTRTLGGSGGVLTPSTPKFFKTRYSEIASEAIFVLKSGQFLP